MFVNQNFQPGSPSPLRFFLGGGEGWGIFSSDDVGDVDRQFHCSEEKLNAFLIFVFVSHIVICMQGTTPSI